MQADWKLYSQAVDCRVYQQTTLGEDWAMVLALFALRLEGRAHYGLFATVLQAPQALLPPAPGKQPQE